MDDISSVPMSVCTCVYVSMCVGVKKNDLEKNNDEKGDHLSQLLQTQWKKGLREYISSWIS